MMMMREEEEEAEENERIQRKVELLVSLNCRSYVFVCI